MAAVLTLLPIPASASHDDAEAAVCEEFQTRFSDPTQNHVETTIIGHETDWKCSIRALYFDLLMFADRFWPSAPAQSALTSAQGLAVVQSDMCA